MKYSLRSLMIVVTVAALLIALWGENWRTCTARQREHAQQADQLDEKGLAKVQKILTTRSGSVFMIPKLTQERQRQVLAHRCLALEYRQAIWQPWKRWWIEELPPQDTQP